MQEENVVSLIDRTSNIGWEGLTAYPVFGSEVSVNTEYSVQIWTEMRDGNDLVARARIINKTNAPLHIRCVRWRSTPAAGHTLRFPAMLQPHYFSTENLRGDYLHTGTYLGDRYFRPLPIETVEIGWSEDRVFPGLFIASRTCPVGVFCAAASQERFFVIYRLRGCDAQGNWFFEIEEHPGGVAEITLDPGETLHGERIYFGIVATNDPQQATAGYYRTLESTKVYVRRSTNPLREQRIYCSWNYDFFAQVTEADILRQLPILKEQFPRVKFVQLDDGYQMTYASGQRAMIDMLYHTDEPFHPAKFPSGAKGLADQIRNAGLRPAIWLGLWAAMGSPMIQEHPDWILLDDTGQPVKFEQSYGGTCILDPSVPGVQEYLDRLCRVVFEEWRYEGVKLDFGSIAFCSRRVRYRYRNKTAAQLEQWLVHTFRKYLPEDGFFGWCVVAGTGSPLTTPGADYFRNAEDIGEGDWNRAKRIALWTANTNMLLQYRPVPPNIDSIGYSTHFEETEWQTWLNLCAVSGMALELSGDLTKLDVSRIERLRRTLDLSDPNRRVWCADVPWEEAVLPPSVWVAEGTDDRLVAIFNWNDEAQTLSLEYPALRRVVERFDQIRDAWTNERVTEGLPSHVHLPTHGSTLWFLTR